MESNGSAKAPLSFYRPSMLVFQLQEEIAKKEALLWEKDRTLAQRECEIIKWKKYAVRCKRKLQVTTGNNNADEAVSETRHDQTHTGSKQFKRVNSDDNADSHEVKPEDITVTDSKGAYYPKQS